MSGQQTDSAGTVAARMWTKPQVIAVYTSYLLINFTCQVNCLHADLKNTPVPKNREPKNSPKPHIFERHPNSQLPMCFSFAYPKTSSVSLVLQLFFVVVKSRSESESRTEQKQINSAMSQVLP